MSDDLGVIEMEQVEPSKKPPKKSKILTQETKEETPVWSVFPTSQFAKIPQLATDHSAAYDISACLEMGEMIDVFTHDNAIKKRAVIVEPSEDHSLGFWINPKERILVPTRLIMLINPDFYVKIYCRSGISLKKGLTLINKVGIIDADYTDEVYITLYNESSERAFIKNGERLCQAILAKRESFIKQLPVAKEKPSKLTNRDGGFGSTGTSN